MKQERSSTALGNEGDLDARDTSTIDMEDPELFAEGLVHLSTCLQNQTRNIYPCKQCSKIIPSIIHVLDKFRSNLMCEDCSEISCDCCDDEEWDTQGNFLPRKHMSIHLSFSKTKKIKSLQDQIETLNNNIQNLSSELNRLKNSWQRLSQEFSSLQINSHQQDPAINELKSNQDKSEEDLLKIKQEMEDLHYATYDGSLIWIIEEFQKKFTEAELGKQTSIYSPIFYSSPSGYEMRARLDLYGDGDARGTHMSVSLVILKGRFDPILPWPFSYQVTFCLFDQTGQGHHIIDSFYPDITSASFQQPSSKENIASGILKFLSLAAFQQQGKYYVLNDTMRIKVMVDFLGTPRSVLPYTLSINPALPSFEQNAIRSRIIEQHNQIEAQLVAQIHADDQEVADSSLIPVYPPAPAGILQQPPPSTTNSESISCEDILHK